MITCPKCGTSHDRGPLNGFDGYRCLSCGEGFNGDRARIVSLTAELGRHGKLVVVNEEQSSRFEDATDFSITVDGELRRIEKHIVYFGQRARHSCDGQCSKAWGLNSRPSQNLTAHETDPAKYNPDDYYLLSDAELGDAPVDPGTYEGDHAKPAHVSGPSDINKWCVRECERGRITKPGRPYDETELRDFSQRVYNIASSRGKVPA